MCVGVAFAMMRARQERPVRVHVYCCEVPVGTVFQEVVVKEATGEVVVVVFMES